jgi:hypothetical protein
MNSLDLERNKYFDDWASKSIDPRVHDFLVESAFIDLQKCGGNLEFFFYHANYERSRPRILGRPSTDANAHLRPRKRSLMEQVSGRALDVQIKSSQTNNKK